MRKRTMGLLLLVGTAASSIAMAADPCWHGGIWDPPGVDTFGWVVVESGGGRLSMFQTHESGCVRVFCSMGSNPANTNPVTFAYQDNSTMVTVRKFGNGTCCHEGGAGYSHNMYMWLRVSLPEDPGEAGSARGTGRFLWNIRWYDCSGVEQAITPMLNLSLTPSITRERVAGLGVVTTESVPAGVVQIDATTWRGNVQVNNSMSIGDFEKEVSNTVTTTIQNVEAQAPPGAVAALLQGAIELDWRTGQDGDPAATWQLNAECRSETVVQRNQ